MLETTITTNKFTVRSGLLGAAVKKKKIDPTQHSNHSGFPNSGLSFVECSAKMYVLWFEQQEGVCVCVGGGGGGARACMCLRARAKILQTARTCNKEEGSWSLEQHFSTSAHQHNRCNDLSLQLLKRSAASSWPITTVLPDIFPTPQPNKPISSNHQH